MEFIQKTYLAAGFWEFFAFSLFTTAVCAFIFIALSITGNFILERISLNKGRQGVKSQIREILVSELKTEEIPENIYSKENMYYWSETIAILTRAVLQRHPNYAQREVDLYLKRWFKMPNLYLNHKTPLQVALEGNVDLVYGVLTPQESCAA